MIKDQPSATLAPLTRIDGSASFSSHGYSVIGAVNGPIEVQRRDELPEEAAVDVVVRPATGVGCIRERHLESIVQSTLRHIILVSAHPRTQIQVTLQIIDGQGDESASSGVPQSATVGRLLSMLEAYANVIVQNLPVLPALLQTAMLALLTTSIPLCMTLTSTLIAVDANGELVSDPAPKELKSASSVHVFAFSSLGDLLVIESEGDFTIGMWENLYATAEQICRGRGEEDEGDDEDEDVDMESKEGSSKEDMLRSVIQEQARIEQRWKQSLG